MKHSAMQFLIRSSLSVLLLPLAVGQVSAQTPSLALLELKSCGRTLTVFDDHTVVETFTGGQTRRQLSEKQMSKLRKVTAIDPCERQLAERARKPPATKPWSVTSPDGDACFRQVLGYPRGLLEIFVTRHYPDHDRGMAVYVPCGKETISSFHKKQINPKWKRFIYEVVDAIGGQSIIAACQCRQVD